MTAKTSVQIVSLALFLVLALPSRSALIVEKPVAASNVPVTENPRAGQLLQRLTEIRAMDKTGLSNSERKNLRKEVKGIKKEMKATKGVYLSVGAIIIIILLLILIL